MSPKTIASTIVLSLFASLACWYMTSCSSMTPSERASFDKAALRAAKDAEAIGLNEYAKRSK